MFLAQTGTCSTQRTFRVQVVSPSPRSIYGYQGVNRTDNWHREAETKQCWLHCGVECTDLYIRETKQPLYECMAQRKRADSAFHLYLKDKCHCFEGSGEKILARKDRWFERGGERKSSLNRGGGLKPSLWVPVFIDWGCCIGIETS